jgi:hypothetical protein
MRKFRIFLLPYRERDVVRERVTRTCTMIRMKERREFVYLLGERNDKRQFRKSMIKAGVKAQ